MKRFILVLLAFSLVVLPASATDYHIGDDYNTTVPVDVPASSTVYLIAEMQSGFTPTSSVYEEFDSTLYTVDHLGTEGITANNITYEADIRITSTGATNWYGLSDTNGIGNEYIAIKLNADGVDYARVHTNDGLNSDTYEYSGYSYDLNWRHVIFNINDSKATVYLEGCGWSDPVDYLPTSSLNFYFEEGSGEIKNQKVTKYYDNGPTVTTSNFGENLALIQIDNPNTFALNDYQVTFDFEGVDQTAESINVTAYSSLDVPVPTSPINNENLVYEYPPIVNEVNLTWTGNGGNTYSYEVRDIGGTLIASGSTSNTYAIVEIPEGSYYWTVESDLTETMDSLQSYFMVSNTYITAGTTSVVGVVYEMENFVKSPIGEAVVYISNDTFSDHESVGSDGYFSFTGLTANTTYYLKASATDYDTSEIALVTPAGGNTTVKDILLVPETKYYESHKVKFVVQTIWGSVYSGVDVDVYKTGSINSLVSGETGTDGSITFELDEEIEYRITFVNTTQGINEDITIYPMAELYTIYPTTEDVERVADDIKFGAIGSNINLTAGYINASFLDTSGTTTLAELWINETDGTNLYYFSTANSSATWSQVVAANNTTYLVHFSLQNTELTGSFLQDRVISFNEGVTGPFNFGFTEQWHYQLLGTALILFVGLLFGAVNAQMGAVVVVLLGWFNVYTGWYPSNVKTILMLMMATLVAGAFYLRKGEDIR